MIILVLTKADEPTSLNKQELELLLGLESICAEWGQQFRIVKASHALGGYEELVAALKGVKIAEKSL